MPFSLDIRLQALIACERQCCLCHQRKHTRMQCHHIIPESEAGPDTPDNCIPLCPDCHAEVMSFNPKHPFGGTPYHPHELRRRRDDWYAIVRRKSENLATKPHHQAEACPHNNASRGSAAFDYSKFNGFYRLGEGNSEFLTRWSRCGVDSIYCYRDRTNVSVGLAPRGAVLRDITDASLLHYASRVQEVEVGGIAVLENHATRYAAIRVNE